MSKPTFIIKKNTQKVENHFKAILTKDMLTEICLYITGEKDYICQYKDNSYGDKYFERGKWNIGRLLILHHDNKVAYIALSMPDNVGKKAGRNSAVESVGVLYNKYYVDSNSDKRLYYYFVGTKGLSTPYFNFNYRVFKTIGFEFINDQKALGTAVQPFSTVEDIIIAKNLITKSAKNNKNNPTYVTLSEDNTVQIFAKTFGAHKYESSMLVYALSMIARDNKVELYEITDNGLSSLPEHSQDVIKTLRNIKTCSTSITLEKKAFDKKESLRSPVYIYNLLHTVGQKKCALCGCTVQQIIQGAHIWPVASIKKRSDLSFDEKFEHATSGNNGLWMCENHHKLFDADLLKICNNGKIEIQDTLNQDEVKYIKKITETNKIPSEFYTKDFTFYLNQRYS